MKIFKRIYYSLFAIMITYIFCSGAAVFVNLDTSYFNPMNWTEVGRAMAYIWACVGVLMAALVAD